MQRNQDLLEQTSQQQIAHGHRIDSEQQYTFNELREYLENLQGSQAQQKSNLEEQSLAKKIDLKSLKQIKTKKGTEPLSLLFGFNNYISLSGSYDSNFTRHFELITHLKNELLDSSSNDLLVIGESGSGKTLLLLKLLSQIQNVQAGKDSVFVDLKEIANGTQDLNQIKLDLLVRISDQLTHSQNQQRELLLVLLDGYDELRYLQIRQILQDNIKNYNKIKLLVTSSLKHTSENDHNLDNPRKIFICALRKQQIHSYINGFIETSQKLKDLFMQQEILDNTQDYQAIFDQFASLINLATNPSTLYLIMTQVPELKSQLTQKKYSRYEILEIITTKYTEKRLEIIFSVPITQNDDDDDQKIQIPNDQKQNILKDVKHFNQNCSWLMLQQQGLELDYKDVQSFFSDLKIPDFTQEQDFFSFLQEISPTTISQQNKFRFISKQFYEFYIAQSIIVETVSAKSQALDLNATKISSAFLRFDLEILSLVAEHVMEQEIRSQYEVFFETWYRSVLLTRKIYTEKLEDQNLILKLKKIGSNCINLLAAIPRCDLTERDFQGCAIPYAYFYKRDLSGSTFKDADLSNCMMADARLDRSEFLRTNLRGLSYGRYPDFVGHNSIITSVAFTPDSKILVSGSFDNTVKLWNVETQTELTTLHGHGERVSSVSVSPDGKYVASSSYDNTVRLWSIEKQNEFAILQAHSNAVTAVSFSPDGKFLASGSWDKNVRLWSLETQNDSIALQGHTDTITSVAFSPDNKQLVSGSWDRTVRIWTIQNQTELATLLGHTKEIISVAFSPDGEQVASGSYDSTLRLWSVQSRTLIITLHGHSSPVTAVAFSPDGIYLSSASYDRTVKVWNVHTHSESVTLYGHTRKATAVKFSPDGKYLASGSRDRVIKLWSLENQKEIATLEGHTNVTASVALSRDGKQLFSGSWDGTVKIWNTHTQTEIATLLGHNNKITSIAVSADSKYLVSGSDDKTLKLWNLESYAEILTLHGHTDIVTSVAVSADLKVIASGSYDCTVRLWSTSTRSQLATFQGHAKKIFAVALSADSTIVASASDDCTVKFWSLETLKEINKPCTHRDRVMAVAFSADGKYVASGGAEEKIQLWSLQTQQEAATLKGHRQWITSVAFSSDSKLLVSGSYDCEVKLWNIETQDEIATLKGHSKEITSVAFSADGLYIASGSYDNTIEVWNIAALVPLKQLGNEQAQSQLDQEKPLHLAFPQRNAQRIIIGRQSVSFGCSSAIFDECLFASEEEAKRADKVFNIYKCLKFDKAQY